MSSAKTIVELRELLSAKFPGVRMHAGNRERNGNQWATGIDALDEILEGGFIKGGVTELVSGGTASGSALILGAMIRSARARGEWMALIDGNDSFEASEFSTEELQRLLWVRCRNVKEALKAADILLRDGNMQVVALDLAFSVQSEWRGVAATVWHRFRRLVETHGTAFVAITPRPTVANCNLRLALDPQFDIAAFDHERRELESLLHVREAEAERHHHHRTGAA